MFGEERENCFYITLPKKDLVSYWVLLYNDAEFQNLEAALPARASSQGSAWAMQAVGALDHKVFRLPAPTPRWGLGVKERGASVCSTLALLCGGGASRLG